MACSSREVQNVTTVEPKEFSKGEIILASEVLNKIFDKEMSPIQCVPDIEEAELLLRTLRPRLEIVQDDLEAVLDDPKEINKLIETCDQSCTCKFIDEMMREHQVSLTKMQRKNLSNKNSEKETARCMNYVQETFCQGELFKTLDKEKEEFSF